MGNKINRNYRLLIQNNPVKVSTINLSPFIQAAGRLLPQIPSTYSDNKVIEKQQSSFALEITPPFTIEFDIKRSIGTDDNSMMIKIYGLSEKSRKQLVKDYYNTQDFLSGGQYRQVILTAGYEKDINVVFAGTLIEGYSVREGVDEVTYLYCVSGAYGRYNNFINQSFAAGTPYNQIIDYIINQLTKDKYIEKGAIQLIDGSAQTGYLALGDGFNILSEFGPVFIDLNKINFLQLDYVINKTIGAKDIQVISAETGLLGTPMRRNTFIEVNSMFQPKIQLGQLIEIKSITAPYFNGQFKVMGIQHKGMISNAKPGTLITTLQLYIGSYLINSFKAIGT